MKDLNPYILALHCAAYRLALAAAHVICACICASISSLINFALQASKDVSWVAAPFRSTLELGRWIHASPDRFTIWKKFRDETGEDGLVIKSPSDTRWLTVNFSCQALKTSLVTTAKTLHSLRKSDATAFGMLHQILSAKYLTLLLTFCDALPALSMLSQTFQREDLDISMIENRVRDTKAVIEQLIDHPGRLLLVCIWS